MQIYYNQHYIRKHGKFHDKSVQWRADASKKFGKKFGITEKIRAARPAKFVGAIERQQDACEPGGL